MPVPSHRWMFRRRPESQRLYEQRCGETVQPTTHISLKASLFSSEITSSAIGINWRLYEEIVTSPRTPSSSSTRVMRVDILGTRRRV